LAETFHAWGDFFLLPHHFLSVSNSSIRMSPFAVAVERSRESTSVTDGPHGLVVGNLRAERCGRSGCG
jgi:hypothetical protein